MQGCSIHDAADGDGVEMRLEIATQDRPWFTKTNGFVGANGRAGKVVRRTSFDEFQEALDSTREGTLQTYHGMDARNPSLTW